MKKLESSICCNFYVLKRISYYFLFCILILNTQLALAQDSTVVVNSNEENWRDSAVKVFLDLSHMVFPYASYMKTEIPFINFVRDVQLAQVYILVTSQQTGGGGTEYTITILGQKEFSNKSDTLTYVLEPTATFEMRRSEMARNIKMGLIPYVVKTPISDDINIVFNRKIKPSDAVAVMDKWNNWVFNINVNGNINGEQQRNHYSVNGALSADRVTEAWKLSFSMNSNYNETNYDYENYQYKSIRRSQNSHVLVAKSITNHWSTGLYSSGRSDIYSNTKRSFAFAPLLEYNVFPYSVSTRREFRLTYFVNYQNIHYNEETIYDKLKEQLFSNNLSANFELKEKWGSVRITLSGSHYFHDFEKNRLNLNGNISLRLFKGLSFNVGGGVSMIHDQLSLAKGNLSQEDLLLHRKQLETQYNFHGNIGIRYTFGSIYSNVVNPRFGD